jgi:hypothetical protein
MPARKLSSPSQRSNMASTPAPLLYVMPSNAFAMSWSLAMGCRMLLALSSESAFIAAWTCCRRARSCWYSGWISWTTRWAIHVANDSLSHRSSHHGIVTRFPNHECASSWAITLAKLRPDVLHRASREVRHRDDVELREGVGACEVALQALEQGAGVVQGEAELGPTSARRQAAKGQAVLALRRGGQRRLDHVERTHRPGHEIGRKRRGRCEADAAPPARVLLFRQRGAVADGDVAVGDGEGQLEGRLEGGLVEARKGASGSDGLELGEDVVVSSHPNAVDAR